MSDYPKILQTREASSMVSTWNEYLRVDRNGDGTAKLEICRYEALTEAEYDEDGNELPLPAQIDGKDVIGVEDDYVVGGSLSCWDDRFLVFSIGEIEVAISWLKSNGFKTGTEIIGELQKAVEIGKSQADEQDYEELSEVEAWRKHRDRQRMRAGYPPVRAETLEGLTAYCRENERVCPLPPHWQRLWEMLPIRFRDRASIRPPAPLILAAWHDTSPMLKMLRLKEHIEWAAQDDALGAVGQFLRDLREEDWFHIGE
jgi:hypothetical protein